MMGVTTATAGLTLGATQPRGGGLTDTTAREVSDAIMSGATWEGLDRMMLAVGIVFVGLALLAALRAYRRCRHSPPDVAIYVRAARALGLSWSQCLLMWRVARRGCTAEAGPAAGALAMLLSRGAFDRHVERSTAALRGDHGGHVKQRCAEVRRAVFPDRIAETA